MLIIESILLAYFSFCVAYIFIFSVAGKFNRYKLSASEKGNNKIAVLIPAYKEDSVIVSVAIKAVQQDYPANLFNVVVIADQLQKSTLEKLKLLPITLVKVSFEKSTKTKALNAAMAQIENDYDIAVVLDADNIMEPDFLTKISNAYNEGHKVIQGRRVAKNMNTSFATLDALSEIINNHIFRKGRYALGLSSSLIGSGMAFDYKIFKNTLMHMDAVGGFDRELHMRLVEKRLRPLYLESAMVYDEKVDKPENFANQRRRWLSSQFVYLRKYFSKGLKALFKGNIDLFDSAIIGNIQLPRVLTLGMLCIIAFIATILYKYTYFNPLVWWALIGINLLAFAVAVPSGFYSMSFFRSILSLPQAFGLMLLSLFKIKGANKQFIHTPHGQVDIGAR